MTWREFAGREFDAVVDTCGFVPEVVGRSAAVLRNSGAFYAYVSSMSATTTWPVATTPDDAPGQDCPSDAGPDDGDYGKLKAGCERAVTETFGDRALVVRSGLIIGPHENVGRLPWWLTRIARGGEVLAPGDPDVAMQLVDARDLAAFMLDAALAGTGGTVNATGPRGNATMGSWLADCVTATGSGATLTWVADDLLLAHEVEPWTELPLWMPPGQEADHVWDSDTAEAERLGLRSRPVTETVARHLDMAAGGGRRSAGTAAAPLPRPARHRPGQGGAHPRRAPPTRRLSRLSAGRTPAHTMPRTSASRPATRSGSTHAAKCPPGMPPGSAVTTGQPRDAADRAGWS